jgi:hypothetical protein
MEYRMKKFTAAIFIALMSVVVIACSEKSSPAPQTEQPTGVIPQAQLDALNKAKNVQNVMNEQDDKTREAADSQ